MNEKLKLWLIGVAVTIMAAFVLLYISVPYTVSGNGVVLPAAEWSLTRNDGGAVVSSLRSNVSNSIKSYSSTEFQRGDHLSFTFNGKIDKNEKVRAGDTIGHFDSHLEQYKLMELKREKAELKRQRNVLITGDTPHRIEAAKEALELARLQLETEERQFERSEQLYSEDVISDRDFEMAQNSFQTKKRDVLIAEANYREALSGSKKEEVDLIDTAIDAVDKQINSVKERLDAFVVTSPLTGTFIEDLAFEQGGLIAGVASIDSMVLMMPVEVGEIQFLNEGMTVDVAHSLFKGAPVSGRVINIDKSVQTLDQRQTVFVTALLENHNDIVLSNLKVRATISCGEITIVEYLKRLTRKIYQS
ncbi:hypothetical protein QA597_09100 [Marinilabiliaceae bacterium ANBcel2]|nr:hypothetical protein [Marinilabiliaceae bacterium ANBcel2]